MTETLLKASFLFIAYTYAVYPLLLLALRRRSPAPAPSRDRPVTVVIAAFNEEAAIAATLSTILASDYPPEALEVLVVSDASTDGTDRVVSRFPAERVRLLRQPVRRGQTAGLWVGCQNARGELVILADASGHFRPDTVRRFVRHFADPRVGAVSGYKAARTTGGAVSPGDGLYARYDMTLRRLESQMGGSWVGCEGGAFALRKDLFQPAFPLDIAADNATCYQIYEKGMIHRFDPEAVIVEPPARDLRNEFERKIRIIVLQLKGFAVFRRLFVPWRHPAFFFQNVSHKLFRWLVPFALLLFWAASAASPQPWARALFWGQNLFYATAFAGMLCERRFKVSRLVAIPAYFVTVNLSGLLAWTFLFRDYTLWNPPVRGDNPPLNPL